MTPINTEIRVQNLDHLGLIAGIIDELGIVDTINELVGIQPGEIVTAGVVVKAIILNGLGFVSRPLYLFPQFFQDKATEHLLGKGIWSEHLNDDKIGRVMDKLYAKGLTNIFLLIALAAVKKQEEAQQLLSRLAREKFESAAAAKAVFKAENKNLKYHQLNLVKLIKVKEKKSQNYIYKIEATLLENTEIIAADKKRAGRFFLATNILKSQQLTADEMLTAYREQQAPERGFAFLKDPLFFADSVFLKTAERIETMAMLMGLCLLVYQLGQRQLRLQLKQGQTGLKNQLGKLTDRPTLRWIFQCFQGIHVVFIKGVKQISNLTNERRDALSFFPEKCQQYYFSSA